MITGFTAAEMRAIKSLLLSPHWIHVRVMVMDLNHNPKGDLTDRLIDGQVNFDVTADVTRTAELVLSDPKSTLSLVPDSPTSGALFMNTMIRVVYSIAPPDQSVWYSIPLITGPVAKMKRNGDGTVTVRVDGKDRLGFASVWKTIDRKKGFKVTALIEDILIYILGESKRQVVDRKRTLSKDTSINRASVPIQVIRRLARSLDLIAYYDGRGVFRLRAFSNNPVFKFTERSFKTQPSFDYDPEKIKNVVEVIGGKPKGSKKKVRGHAIADNSHPLSPQKLGREVVIDGETVTIPRYYLEQVNAPSAKTRRACNKLAQQVLQRRLMESLLVEGDTMPVPIFEEHDPFRIEVAGVSANGRMTQWSIGLRADSAMSLGVVKRVSFKPRAKKRHPKRHHGTRGPKHHGNKG